MSDHQTSSRRRHVSLRKACAPVASAAPLETPSTSPVRHARLAEVRRKLKNPAFNLDTEFKLAMHKLLQTLGA
jgi:hypothetical protein